MGVNCSGTAAGEIVTADGIAGEGIGPCASGKARLGLNLWSTSDPRLCVDTGGSAKEAVGV